jgi:hypothetical protein
LNRKADEEVFAGILLTLLACSAGAVTVGLSCL